MIHWLSRFLIFVRFANLAITIINEKSSNETKYNHLIDDIEDNTHQQHHHHLQSHHTRRLQFEGMYDLNNNNIQMMQAKRNKMRKIKPSPISRGNTKGTRNKFLSKAIDEIIMNSERYNMWWTGPIQDNDFFQPVSWAAQTAHNISGNAVFTMATMQGTNDIKSCSSPNDLKLYLGTLRKFYTEDIVIALEADQISTEIKNILHYYRAIVYVLPKDLCNAVDHNIFCGSDQERVPASVFRYNFFEKWAILYISSSLILITDFRDVIFQSNPFEYRLSEWNPSYQLIVFQEFHPNMVINRDLFNRRVMAECFGDEALRQYGHNIIISSGAFMGTRDGILIWTHHMTMQLQDAPGRMVETRCTTGGIEHSFVNWLVYGQKLRSYMKIRIYAHGEGLVNSLGGLKPNTVEHVHISGNLSSFWHLLDDHGYVRNWNGEISPVVHQLDHFQSELIDLATNYIEVKDQTDVLRYNNTQFGSQLARKYMHSKVKGTAVLSERIDLAWQALAVSQCLFDCMDSLDFDKA